MSKEIKLFLSSTFNEMREQRDYFRNEIIAELNQIVGQVSKNLYLYDFELGISKDKSFTNVLDICFQKIDESEYFVAIFENKYGTHINDEFKDKQETYFGKYEQLVTQGAQEDLSVLELESIKALDNPKQKKLFFIKAIKDDEQPKRDDKLQKLVFHIETNPLSYIKIFHYSEPENILTELKEYFCNEI
jgi:preprotein translocase subunit SecA/nephrocystin-3